jgi:hypothetical protein
MKKTDKKGTKKVERTPVEKVVAMDRTGSKDLRALFNKVLKESKGAVVLRENAHGAIQIVRESDKSLMFSMRSDGRLLMTAPIYSGSKGKKKVRVFKHPGNKWDHMSMVPFKDVTMKMLTDRISDKKTSKQYHDEFYSKNPAASGLVAKAKRASVKIESAKKSTDKKKKNVIARTPAKKSTDKKKNVIVRKKVSKKTAGAIADVAAIVSA